MPNALPPDVVAAIEHDLRTAEQPRQREIARKHGVSPGSVHNIAKRIGVSFDRSRTENATQAAVIDNDAELERIARRMLAEANAALDRMHGEFLVYNFGGRDNDYNEHTLAEAPVDAQRQLMTIAAIAVDKALKVRAESRGSEGSQSAWEAFLRSLASSDDDGVDYSAP